MESPADSDEDEGGGFQPELIRSYFSFVRRAVAERKLIVVVLSVTVLVLASVAAAVWPRTYESELRLLVQRSPVLDMDERTNPLEGAADVVTRHEALEALVRQLDMAKNWQSARTGALRLKDMAMEKLRGKPSEADIADALVMMLEGRLWARVDGSALNVGIDWPDGRQAKQIVDAATDGFLESRHHAEISVIEEKTAILEGHANQVRAEIDGIAQELSRLKDAKVNAAEKAAQRVSQATASSASPAPAPRRPPVAAPVETGMPAEDLASMKEDLERDKRKLLDLQNHRSQALLEAKAKLADLKLKLTEDHPDVRSAQQHVNALAVVPQEETVLVVQVESLEASIKSGSKTGAPAGIGGGGGGRAGGSSSGGGSSDSLPAEILKLLDTSGDTDPAVSTQLATALGKYSELRNAIRTARVNLDTAQAAFNFRYKIVVPASMPLKPSKPNVLVILGGGLGAALLLALLVPLLLELKRGVIIERWQVHMLGLPVLGDVRTPSGDS